MRQAPKGGITIQGVFYRGGQFLPQNEPQRGKFNRANKSRSKVRKAEIAPYQWVENPDGKIPLYPRLNGTFARFENGVASYAGNEKILNYMGLTEDQARDMIARFNAGQRWQ